MRYWLAMHYPHYPADEADWFIYVRRGDEPKVAGFDVGDRVAFYEVSGSKDKSRMGKQSKRPDGRSGIVCLATGSHRPRPATFQEAYVDGTQTDFSLECPCQDHLHQHFLSREAMFEFLGRSLRLRGLGGGAGFIELGQEEFNRLEVAFLASPAQ